MSIKKILVEKVQGAHRKLDDSKKFLSLAKDVFCLEDCKWTTSMDNFNGRFQWTKLEFRDFEMIQKNFFFG